MNTTTAPAITTPELGEPQYGGESYVYDDGPMRTVTYTRLPVVNNVEVEYHGQPHRLDFLEVDNATGDVNVWMVRQTKGRVRRDWKLAGRFIYNKLESLRDPAKPEHHAIADAVEAALAPLRVEAAEDLPEIADSEASDQLPFPTDAQLAARDCQDNTTCQIEGHGYLISWHDILVGALHAGDRLLEVDGIATGTVYGQDKMGLLIEEVRQATDGDFHVTVWGATRMFELVLAPETRVSYISGR